MGEDQPLRDHAHRYHATLWCRSLKLAEWEDYSVVEAIKYVLGWALPGDTHITIEVVKA